MPKLIVAALPIDHNWRLLDPRIISAVQECDLLIAEEKKNALRLLAATESREKPFILINEHATETDREATLKKILSVEKSVLVSDAGTPCLADPDYELVNLCHLNNVKIYAAGGTSSITAALSVSGFDARRFIFLGFPPRKDKERKVFFDSLKDVEITSVFLERPYSLAQTLNDLKGLNRLISLSVNIGGGSLDKDGEELNLRGKVEDIIPTIANIKGAFVIVIDKKAL